MQSRPRIAVLDYGIGNLRSAQKGLERVGADGDVFDPMLHDAVLHEAGDDDVQTVAQVLRAGWRWRGRVLRPAMVKVVGG